MVAWTCCEQNGSAGGCSSHHHRGVPGEVNPAISRPNLPYRESPGTTGTGRNPNQHRGANGRYSAVAKLDPISTSNSPGSPAQSIPSPRHFAPPAQSPSYAPTIPEKPERQTNPKLTSTILQNLPGTNSPLGQMTTASLLARIEALGNMQDSPTAPSSSKRAPQPRKPSAAQHSMPAKPFSKTPNTPTTSGAEPPDAGEERWIDFPAYARGREPRHVGARGIIAGPHWRYSAAMGCVKCSRKGIECLWSAEREKCAHCCAQNISKTSCALHWNRSEGEFVPRNDRLTLLLG